MSFFLYFSSFFPWLCSFSSGFWARQDSGPDNLRGHVPPRPPIKYAPVSPSPEKKCCKGEYNYNPIVNSHLRSRPPWLLGPFKKEKRPPPTQLPLSPHPQCVPHGHTHSLRDLRVHPPSPMAICGMPQNPGSQRSQLVPQTPGLQKQALVSG